MIKKILGVFFLAGLAIFLFIQVLPFGRDHSNPPVVQDAPWNSADAHAIAQRACYDCHSNETTWPWYSNIAPLSWLIQRDTLEGRRVLNFSVWGRGEQEMDEIAEVIREGEMPPLKYILLHPSARLSTSDKESLLRGLPGLSSEMNENEEEGD
ncbi:MAG TPA: heme-binding domain-containing protein [Anaerolineales bacterium]